MVEDFFLRNRVSKVIHTPCPGPPVTSCPRLNSLSLRAGGCVGPGEPDVTRFAQATWVRMG